MIDNGLPEYGSRISKIIFIYMLHTLTTGVLLPNILINSFKRLDLSTLSYAPTISINTNIIYSYKIEISCNFFIQVEVFFSLINPQLFS